MSKQNELAQLADVVTVDGSNVGIGTSSVNAKLDVRGTGVVDVGIGSTSAGGAYLYLDGDSNGDFSGSDYCYIGHDSSGQLTISQDSPSGSNNMIFSTAATERMRLDSDGLKFNGDTAAANALNDYEEGSFSAALTATSSGTITLNSSYDTFFYTKVGNLVHISGYIRVSSVSSPTGVIRFDLPFTVANLVDSSSAILVLANGLASGSVTDMWAECSDNSNYGYIYAGGGTSVTGTSAQQTQAATDFRISGTYKTNA